MPYWSLIIRAREVVIKKIFSWRSIDRNWREIDEDTDRRTSKEMTGLKNHGSVGILKIANFSITFSRFQISKENFDNNWEYWRKISAILTSLNRSIDIYYKYKFSS